MVEDSLVSCVEDLVWQEADSSSLLNSGAEGRVGGGGGAADHQATPGYALLDGF